MSYSGPDRSETSLSAPPPQFSKSILIIEDDVTSREVVGQILAAKGYAMATAKDGKQALLYLRQHRPSLILLDLMMPVMDGYEFRRRQLQDAGLASIPVVVLSAKGDDAERADALGGVVGYLQKPIDPAEVVAAVERFMVSRRPEVLVVEDNPDVRRMLDMALRHFVRRRYSPSVSGDAFAPLDTQGRVHTGGGRTAGRGG